MHISHLFLKVIIFCLPLSSWSASVTGRSTVSIRQARCVHPSSSRANSINGRRGVLKSVKNTFSGCCTNTAAEVSSASSFDSHHGPPLVIGSPHPVRLSQQSHSAPSSPLGSSRKSSLSSSSGPSKWNPLIPSTSPSDGSPSPPPLRIIHPTTSVRPDSLTRQGGRPHAGNSKSKGKGKVMDSSSSSGSNSPIRKHPSPGAGPSGTKH